VAPKEDALKAHLRATTTNPRPHPPTNGSSG